MYLMLPTMTKYFDQSDTTSNPLKSSVNFLRFTTDPYQSQQFVYKVSFNDLILQDWPWYTLPKNDVDSKYNQIKLDGYYSFPVNSNVNTLSVSFILDERVQTT